MKHILTIPTFLIFAQLCLGQSITSFEIEQMVLPNGHSSIYEFDGERLIVKENSTIKESLIINKKEITQFDTILNTIDLDTLKESYSRAVIDGIHHTFSFQYGVKEKEIRLGNYYIENLDRFLIAVNDLLKEENRLISLGHDMQSRQDTVIYYLPDFYVDTFDIPDLYNFYRIMCVKKGYFETNILDSIKLCDCRIYPTDKNGEYKIRHHWRAFRTEENSWRREYFDNQNQVFRTEYIEDIMPYEIIKEIVYKDLGAKPSILIYRYFKTEVKNE